MGNNYTNDFSFDIKGFRVYIKPSSPIYRPSWWKTNLAQTKCKLLWGPTNEFTNLEASLWKNNPIQTKGRKKDANTSVFSWYNVVLYNPMVYFFPLRNCSLGYYSGKKVYI
jgi:hypothetical protein